MGRLPEKGAIANLSEFPILADQVFIAGKVVLVLDLESATLTLHEANKQINKHNRDSFVFASVNPLSDGRLFIVTWDMSFTEARGSHIGVFRDGRVEYFRKLDDLVGRFSMSPDGLQAAYVKSDRVDGRPDTFFDHLAVADLKTGNVTRLEMTDDRFLGPVMAKCSGSKRAR